MAETILKSILQELTENEKRVSQDEMEKFADAILKADRIFVAGAGRSGFVARAFANRLMHMGLTVFLSENRHIRRSRQVIFLLSVPGAERQEALW